MTETTPAWQSIETLAEKLHQSANGRMTLDQCREHILTTPVGQELQSLHEQQVARLATRVF